MRDDGVLSVSELTELIKRNLEELFPSVVVEGELSNCRPSSTGHLYFTIKDGGASLQAVMFKNRMRSLLFRPTDGALVRARGSISVYSLRGSYQLVCDSLDAAGTGDILAMLEERKRRLAVEGLFDEDRKRPLPRFPRQVAVVTSPTGAAIRDVLNVLRRRAPGIDVIILGAPVQGAEAGELIAKRIRQAAMRTEAEVLIVGRGGGSIEDLLPFSDEAVVRAIAESPIPVVSAVGHEVDWALSDFAADLRAPTPSAAAELVCADLSEARRSVLSLKDALIGAMETRIDRAHLATKAFSPEGLELRFRSLLQPSLVRFDDAKEDLLRSMNDRIVRFRSRVKECAASLSASDPREILQRGYALVTDKESGTLITSASGVEPGRVVTIRPASGTFDARVENIQGGENSTPPSEDDA